MLLQPMKTILAQLAEDLAAFRTTSRTVVEECLARIGEPGGEGSRAFLKVHAESARAAADYHDLLRKNGCALSPFAGIPVSVKDLFDIAGDVTAAGSPTLQDAPAAERDAECVARLRAAGFILPVSAANYFSAATDEGDLLPIRRPRRAAGPDGCQARDISASVVHDVYVGLTSAIAGEENLTVNRPSGTAINCPIVREPRLATSVRGHNIDLAVAVSTACKHYSFAVR